MTHETARTEAMTLASLAEIPRFEKRELVEILLRVIDNKKSDDGEKLTELPGAVEAALTMFEKLDVEEEKYQLKLLGLLRFDRVPDEVGARICDVLASLTNPCFENKLISTVERAGQYGSAPLKPDERQTDRAMLRLAIERNRMHLDADPLPDGMTMEQPEFGQQVRFISRIPTGTEEAKEIWPRLEQPLENSEAGRNLAQELEDKFGEPMLARPDNIRPDKQGAPRRPLTDARQHYVAGSHLKVASIQRSSSNRMALRIQAPFEGGSADVDEARGLRDAKSQAFLEALPYGGQGHFSEKIRHSMSHAVDSFTVRRKIVDSRA